MGTVPFALLRMPRSPRRPSYFLGTLPLVGGYAVDRGVANGWEGEEGDQEDQVVILSAFPLVGVLCKGDVGLRAWGALAAAAAKRGWQSVRVRDAKDRPRVKRAARGFSRGILEPSRRRGSFRVENPRISSGKIAEYNRQV
jgi:hypothetical protein